MRRLMTELTASDLARLEPGTLEARLGELIGRYGQECSLDLAESVVGHLEALYLHPQVARDADRQCALRRFATHWRWLAEQHRRGRVGRAWAA